MPKEDGVGYGDCTEIKIAHFTKIVSMHLVVTQFVLNKFNKVYPLHYHYVELTAGKGFSPGGVKGSPIAFLEQAEAENFKLPYQADFIECETKNIGELEEALKHEKESKGWKGANWRFHCGKYQEEIPLLLKSKSYEFGLVFVDPSGDLPDFDTLHYIAEMRPKMEILIYLPSTNVKRTYQYTEKRLTDYIDIIGKKNWLIRKAIAWDQFKWTFLLGSNAPIFKDYKSIEFFRLESKQGKDILEKLNLTEKEQIESKQYNLNI
jgi:three-Cys-motif partner protein